MASESVKLGLIGLGVVGTGVVQLLERNSEAITQKLGRPLVLTCVASRSLNTKPHPHLGSARLSTDPWSVVQDPVVDVVIELIGGIEPARSFVLEAIKRGKDVITANKALLAQHGEEIFAAAEARGVSVGFEASVA